ncbi:MAG: hypothetical protein ACXWUL_02190 [Caldimonas sp.]
MKRLVLLLPATALLASAGAVAQGGSYDPKALARYDVSYSRCETTFPEMKGRRDEAYLSLYRAQPNVKNAARLAEVRDSASYKSERRLAAQAAAKASAPQVKTVEQQCRGLLGEMVRMPKLGQ